MKDQCNSCGTKNESSLILMVKTIGNVKHPRHYCPTCVLITLKAVSPSVFPPNTVPDKSVLTDILATDSKMFSRCWNILNPQVREQAKMGQSQNLNQMKLSHDNSSPLTIFEKISEKVIGQDDAKRKMSLAIRRKAMSENNPEISKINLMLIGPTASGKTELGRVASEMLNAPFVKIDCSHLTPSGYRGVNVESILCRLYEASNHVMDRAERGIVLLDEIDKIVRGGEFAGRIQQELLKIIEGDEISFEMDRNKSPLVMNTKNILFIAAGSFPGIEKIANPNKSFISLSDKPKVDTEKKLEVTNIEAKHLIQFGLIPEIVGRFTHTATLKKLGVNELFEIMTYKKGSVASEYEKIFEEMGHKTKFSKEFLMGIASKASQSETGARNLKFLMEEALGEYLFSERPLPDHFLEKKSLKLAA